MSIKELENKTDRISKKDWNTLKNMKYINARGIMSLKDDENTNEDYLLRCQKIRDQKQL